MQDPDFLSADFFTPVLSLMGTRSSFVLQPLAKNPEHSNILGKGKKEKAPGDWISMIRLNSLLDRRTEPDPLDCNSHSSNLFVTHNIRDKVPTDPSTNLEPQKQEIGEFHVAQKCGSTDSEVPKL